MILDIIILAAAAVLAVGIAFLSGSLNAALMLVPVNRAKPLQDRHEGFVRYNLVPYGKLRDRNSYRPKVLLALLLFAVLAALGKGVFGDTGNWTVIVWGGLSIIGLTMLGLGGFTNTAAVLVMLLIGPLIVYFFLVDKNAPVQDADTPAVVETDGTAAQTETPGEDETGISAFPYRWLGLAAGIMVGSFGGIWISRNYRTLLTHTDLEIKRRHTLQGEPIGKLGLLKRRITLYWLIVIPLFVAYQSLTYWVPSIDLGGILDSSGSEGIGAGQYALILLAFGIGMNLLFVTLPLFREMVTSANMTVAAEFNKIVWRWGPEITEPPEETPAVEGDDFDPTATITQFLTPKGEWQSFPRSQLFYFQTAVLALMATGVAQVLIKTAQGGAGTDAVFHGASLTDIGTLLSGITFCANVLFLLVVITFYLRDPGEKDAIEENVKVLWERQAKPDLIVTCAEIEEDDDPILRIVPTGPADAELSPIATDTPNADAPDAEGSADA